MVAKLGSNGEVSHVVRSPHVDQDTDSLRERIVEAAKLEAEQFTESFQQQIEAIDKRIERLTQKPEQELNERDQRRLSAWKQQKEMFESQSVPFITLFFRENLSGKLIEQLADALEEVGLDAKMLGHLETASGFVPWEPTQESLLQASGLAVSP